MSEFKSITFDEGVYEQLKDSSPDDFQLIRILLQIREADRVMKRSGVKGEITRMSKIWDTESQKYLWLFWLDCDNINIVDQIEIRLVNYQNKEKWPESVIFIKEARND